MKIVSRRVVLGGLVVAACAAQPTAPAKAWHSTDMTGALPALDFTMTRATDGKTVTAADYKGKITLLYFGYTSCPDVCPATLMNAAQMIKGLGAKADEARFLFVTVDPKRDSLKTLKDYAGSFAPQIVGLRGTADQLASFAKRYRVAYSVTLGPDGNPAEVTHGTAVYVFNRQGDIKLLFTGLTSGNTDLTAMTDDLKQMVAGAGSDSFWRRLMSWL